MATNLLGIRRVLLKPNLMRGTTPEACNCTHPAFLGAVVRWFRDRDVEIVVGDSSGLVGFTDRVLDASGIRSAAAAAGAAVVNLDAGPFRRLVSDGNPPLVFLVPESLFSVDAVVQVPKLKTHSLLGMTLALKNLVGVLPGATKPALHLARPGPREFARAVLDLHDALLRDGVRLAGAIVDGIWALGGRGPGVGPRPAALGLVAAGRDLAAVDTACALAAGLEPATLPLSLEAVARGLGPKSPGELGVDGPDPRAWDVRVLPARRDFMERTRPTTRMYYWIRGRLHRPIVDPAQCNGSGTCIEVCPVDAIRRQDGRTRIGRDCIRCMACVATCPRGAIHLYAPPWFRPLVARRFDGLLPDPQCLKRRPSC